MVWNQGTHACSRWRIGGTTPLSRFFTCLRHLEIFYFPGVWTICSLPIMMTRESKHWIIFHCVFGQQSCSICPRRLLQWQLPISKHVHKYIHNERHTVYNSWLPTCVLPTKSVCSGVCQTGRHYPNHSHLRRCLCRDCYSL